MGQIKFKIFCRLPDNILLIMALFKNFHERHLMMKGFILQSTIEIERKLDKFLALYFTNSTSKSVELEELIFANERLTFDFKREIVSSLLKKYPGFNPPKDFIKALSDVAPHRNRFAHLELLENPKEAQGILNAIDLSTTLELNDKTIVFKRYKNGKIQFVGYSPEVIAKIEQQMYAISDSLDLLINTVAPQT